MTRVTVVVGIAAAVTAPFVLSAAQFVSLFLAGTFLGALAVLLARSVGQNRGLDSPEALLEAVRSAEAGAVIAVAAGVVAVALGPYGWPVIAVALVAYLVVPALMGRRRTRKGAGDTGVIEALPTRMWVPPFDTCSTAELVRAWGTSYDLLEGTTSPLVRARLAELRALYLDELERRDQEAVQKWLAKGAEALLQDPRRLLHHGDAD